MDRVLDRMSIEMTECASSYMHELHLNRNVSFATWAPIDKDRQLHAAA